MSDATPAISIVLPTGERADHIADAVRTIETMVDRVGGELIVVDGSGHPAPKPPRISPATRWLSQPGASVYQLRLLGYRSARGAIVAATEDHCAVPPDWADRILAAHARWPDAAVVFGAVENGSPDHLIDWASYYVNAARLAPPFGSGPAQGYVTHINVSYKREALAAIDDRGGMGVVDFLHGNDLQRTGAKAYRDDAIRVSHAQSKGFLGTTTAHYHAGRAISGFRRQRMDVRGVMRAVGTPVAALLRFGQITRIGLTRPNRRVFAASLPWVFWLVSTQAAGQLVGYVTGPGNSPYRID